MKLPPLVLFTAAVSAAVFAAAAPSDSPFGDKLGTIHFEVNGTPAAQARVVQGVKLLHHMMYLEADREFARAIEADPKCALAHWGRAMAIVHPLWPDVPDAKDMERGAEHIRRGLAAPPATPRERDYLETLGAYFLADAPKDPPARIKNQDTAWSTLAERYPDDLDALAFSALYHLAPIRYLPKDRSHRYQLEAAAALQRILAKIPDHPGAQHYKIHALDFPMLADRALEVCDTYGSIAPDVPHALHMPTHIFTRRGLWEKSIDFNRRSAEAARKLSGPGEMHLHVPHALDYMVYAYLQRGKYREAEAIRREIESLPGPFHTGSRPGIAFAFAAIPARATLERQRWGEAAKLEMNRPASFPWDKRYLNAESILRFARAVGAARSGQLEAARKEILEQEKLLREISARQPNSYWASQAETQLLAARAWIRLREGAPEEAVALMRRGAELEATTDKEAVTPGEVLPAGDLLGDLLLEVNRPAEALTVFESVLAVSPNRLNSLYGAGRAAERAGDGAKASEHYRQLLEVTEQADDGIERVQHARAFLSRPDRGRAE